MNLFSLKERRIRGELIQVFKLLNGFVNVDYPKLFSLNRNQTRCHGFKLEAKRYNTALCGNFFSYKIVNAWNSLPVDVVTSTSVDMFKKRLDKILSRVEY